MFKIKRRTLEISNGPAAVRGLEPLVPLLEPLVPLLGFVAGLHPLDHPLDLVDDGGEVRGGQRRGVAVPLPHRGARVHGHGSGVFEEGVDRIGRLPQVHHRGSSGRSNRTRSLRR